MNHRYIVALIYLTLSMATDAFSFLQEIGEEKFEHMTTYMWSLFILKMIISACIVMRALCNGSWSNGGGKPKPEGGAT